MQDQNTVKFIFKGKQFQVPIQYNLLGSISKHISDSLFSNRQYEFQTPVSDEIIDSFINFWRTNAIDSIQITADNIIEFEQFNNELQLGLITDRINAVRNSLDDMTINLQKLLDDRIPDKSSAEACISRELDKYINERGRDLISLPVCSLYNIFNHADRSIIDENAAYDLIIGEYNRSSNASILVLLRSLDMNKLSADRQRDALANIDVRFDHRPRFDFKELMDKMKEQEMNIAILKHKVRELQETIDGKEQMNEFKKKENERKINALQEINEAFFIYLTLHNSPNEIDIQNIQMANEVCNAKMMRTYLLPNHTDETGIKYTLNPIKLTCEFTSCSGERRDIIIPRFIDHEGQQYIIKGIDLSNTYNIRNLTFAEDSEVESLYGECYGQRFEGIEIPASVSSIDEKCFLNLASGTRISVSSENKYFNVINDGMLVGKREANSSDFDVIIWAPRESQRLTIPANIKKLSSHCFENCQLLEQVEFNEESQLEEICSYAFSKCAIRSIAIPKTVTRIDDYAFESCTQLREIEFHPESQLRFIGNNVFNSSILDRIEIPAGVLKLKNDWFESIPPLTQISVSPSNHHFKVINDGMLAYREDIESDEFDTILFAPRNAEQLTIPSNIKVLDSFCFANCISLRQVVIPPDSQLRLIGTKSFYKTAIESITIPNGVIAIESCAFESCQHLHIFNLSSESQLRSIGFAALRATQIESLELPEGFSEAKEAFFIQTPSLNRVSVQPSNRFFRVINDGMLAYRKDPESDEFDTILFAPRNAEQLTIPSNIKVLGDSCFENCTSLRQVAIPPDSKLQKICSDAFRRSGIQSISIPRSVTEIEWGAFESCSNLQTVEFHPESQLKKICRYAFSNCGIQSITIPKSVTEIEWDVFKSCANLQTVEFQPGSQLKKICNFSESGLCRIIIPNTVTEIGVGAFQLCSQLQTVEFQPGSHLKRICQFAFCQCGIQSITIPSSVIEIEESAFKSCANLQIVEFQPESRLLVIKDSAFDSSSIQTISIPKHVKKIGVYAFAYCQELRSVIIPEDSELEAIDFDAFYQSPLQHVSNVEQLRNLQNNNNENHQ